MTWRVSKKDRLGNAHALPLTDERDAHRINADSPRSYCGFI